MYPGLLNGALFAVGAGFLVLNLRIFWQYRGFMRLRPSALVTWLGPRPPFYRLFQWTGALLGVLIVYKLAVLRLHPRYVFGETMMLIFYVYALPLKIAIGLGFYQEGIWADTGFLRYDQIGALSWRDGDPMVLILIRQHRQLARRLTVPLVHYGSARRVLRDKIAAHDIHLAGTPLDLGTHDQREDV